MMYEKTNKQKCVYDHMDLSMLTLWEDPELEQVMMSVRMACSFACNHFHRQQRPSKKGRRVIQSHHDLN